MMVPELQFLFLIFVSRIIAQQHQYEILLDNITIDYIDSKVMDIKIKIVEINNKNGINFVYITKEDVPNNLMTTIEGAIDLREDFRPRVLTIRRPFKDILQMEMFDLQSLWVTYCTPPIIWPIKKGATYRGNGWVADSTKFPANLPPGKWFIQITQKSLSKIAVIIKIKARITYFKVNRKT